MGPLILGNSQMWQDVCYPPVVIQTLAKPEQPLTSFKIQVIPVGDSFRQDLRLYIVVPYVLKSPSHLLPAAMVQLGTVIISFWDFSQVRSSNVESQNQVPYMPWKYWSSYFIQASNKQIKNTILRHAQI